MLLYFEADETKAEIFEANEAGEAERDLSRSAGCADSTRFLAFLSFQDTAKSGKEGSLRSFGLFWCSFGGPGSPILRLSHESTRISTK